MNLPSLRKLAQMAISPTSSSGTVTSVSSSRATTCGSGSTSRDDDEEVYRPGVPVTKSVCSVWSCLLKANRREFDPPRCEMRTSKASDKSPERASRAAGEVSVGSGLLSYLHCLYGAYTHLRRGDDSRADTTLRARESASRERAVPADGA